MFDFVFFHCKHALTVVFNRRNLRLENFVDPYYTKSHWYNAYVRAVNPGDVEWVPPVDVATKKCLPALKKRVLVGQRSQDISLHSKRRWANNHHKKYENRECV